MGKRPTKGRSAAAPNPFDLKYTKTKFDVLRPGRQEQRLAGKPYVQASRPAVAKSRAEAVRSRTLLKELRHEGKAGSFLDRRIGKHLSQDEAAAQRFVRIKQSRKDRSAQAFNLNSGDEDEDVLLTHRGRHLQDDEDFDSEVEDESDSSGEPVQDGDNFGNFGHKKTKAEVMRELITKSKQHKFERQREREENEEICESLNEAFDGLRDQIIARHGIRDDTQGEAREDDYDTLLKRMALDRRAAPTDRLRTREEQAAALAAKERSRQDRMKGAKEGDDGADAVEKQISAKVQARMSALMGQFFEDPAGVYPAIVEELSGQHAIALARECRALLAAELSGDRLALLLQLVSRIFSTSDAHHLVATPSMLCAARWLMTRGRNTHHGLAICSILLDFQRDSRRWVPEVVNFVASVLNIQSRTLWTRPVELVSTGDAPTLASMICGRGDVFAFAKTLVQRILALYNPARHRVGSLLIAESLIVKAAEPARIGPQDRLATLPELGALLGVQPAATRDTFNLKAAAPVALPSLNPAVEDAYLPGRLRKRTRAELDPTVEQAKLKRAVKKETKGVRRELLRDAQFLARQASREGRAREAQYKQRLQQTYGQIANEAHALRK